MRCVHVPVDDLASRYDPAALGGVPYLTAEPRPLPRDRFNLGLVWAAGDWDPRRGLPVPLLAPLADIPGVTLWSLQRGGPHWPISERPARRRRAILTRHPKM